jgi:hypothetical protein
MKLLLRGKIIQSFTPGGLMGVDSQMPAAMTLPTAAATGDQLLMIRQDDLESRTAVGYEQNMGAGDPGPVRTGHAHLQGSGDGFVFVQSVIEAGVRFDQTIAAGLAEDHDAAQGPIKVVVFPPADQCQVTRLVVCAVGDVTESAAALAVVGIHRAGKGFRKLGPGLS